MKNENKKKLESILSAFESKYKNLMKEQESKTGARKEFLDGFKRLCDEKIKPVMNEIGQILREKGHDFIIHDRRENKNEKGGTFDSRITMEIYPNGKGRGGTREFPAQVFFSAQKDKEKITVHEKKKASGTTEDTTSVELKKYTLTTLSTDDIEREIMESIAKIFQYDPNAIATARMESHTHVL